MDKYLKDLKNAVNSISAESDLTERAVLRVRNNKRNADSSELNFSSGNSGDKERYIQTDIKTAGKRRRIIPVVTAACLIAVMVSVPVILGRYSSDSILPENGALTPAYTEDSAADGSNTLYSLVPHEQKINSEENFTESDQTDAKECNIKKIEPQLKDERRISSIEVTDGKIKCVYFVSDKSSDYNAENGGIDQQRAVEYDLSGSRLEEKMYPDESGFYQTGSQKLINELYVLVPSDTSEKDEETPVYVYDYETTGKLGDISIRPSDFPEGYYVSSAAECENGSVLCILSAGIYGAEVNWSKKPEYFYKLAVVSPSGEIRVISDGTVSEMFKEYSPEPSPQKDGTFAFVSDGKLYSYNTTDDTLSVVCSLKSDYHDLSGPVYKVNDNTYILTRPTNTSDRKDFYILTL